MYWYNIGLRAVVVTHVAFSPGPYDARSLLGIALAGWIPNEYTVETTTDKLTQVIQRHSTKKKDKRKGKNNVNCNCNDYAGQCCCDADIRRRT